MKQFMSIVPISLVIAARALGQAGAEGEPESLLPLETSSPVRVQAPVVLATAPAMRPSASVPASAAPAPRDPAPEVRRATPPKSQGTPRPFSEYDFGEVVQTLKQSVQPLAGEMQDGFPRFVGQIDDAVVMMDQGRTQEAVALSAEAISGVLAARDGVVNPLWEAQYYLNEQIGMVRARLAESLSTGDPASKSGKVTKQTEGMLDDIAKRIAQTKDPARKQRLIAHYRTMRTMAKVRATSLSLSPDQRKLWFSVLKVLEQASVAHQQVLMGSEALFAQLDGASIQLRDYLSLMQTVEGVDALLGSVEDGGMAGFVDGMRTLQEQMETFSQSMQGALESSMIDLETRVDSIQASANEGGSILSPTSVDDELQSRINRMAPSGAAKE